MPASLSGIVLAGGRSRRLGLDKALIRTGSGQTLVEQAFSLLVSRCDDVHVVVDRPDRPLPGALAGAAVPDQRPGCGPLGGIYTGLRNARHDLGIVLACDMPFVQQGVLDLLLACLSEADALVPRALGRTQPLLAAYRKSCLPAIKAMLDRGELTVERLLERVHAVYLDEEALRAADPDLRSFFNINSREDLEQARKMGL